MDEVEQPLMGTYPYSPLRPDDVLPLRDGRLVSNDAYITPQNLDVDTYAKMMLKAVESRRRMRINFIRELSPPDLCWTQAFIGCPIRVSVGKTWAESFLSDLKDVEKRRFTTENEWLQLMLKFVNLLLRYSDGFYPVTQSLFRGPIDMVASALGTDKICMAMRKQKEELGKFLETCSEIFIEALKAQQAITPLYHGGNVSGGIWAPGSMCRTQADYAVMFSPQVYDKQIAAHDERIVNAFDYTWFHTHTANIHIVDTLVEMPKLKAVEVCIDYPSRGPTSPTIPKLLPIFKKIQKSKPLILGGTVTDEELRLLLKELSPRGLSVNSAVVSPQ